VTLNNTTKETEKIIKSLKSKNAHWYVEICTKILKVSTPFIIFPLTYVCNKSCSSGIFPSQLKCSEIKPLYKVGEN
jgi:protein involved in ribonucleotide reduction